MAITQFPGSIDRRSGTISISGSSILDAIARQLPPGLKLDIIRDQSVFIKGSVDAIYEHLVLGGLLGGEVRDGPNGLADEPGGARLERDTRAGGGGDEGAAVHNGKSYYSNERTGDGGR